MSVRAMSVRAMSVRARVALAGVAGALVVLVASGVVLGAVLARREYRDLDRQVSAVAQAVTPVLVREASARGAAPSTTVRERLAAQVADATGASYSAVAVRDGVVVATSASASSVPVNELVRQPLGLSTLRDGDAEYRVRVSRAGQRRNLTVAVAMPTAPARQRVSAVRSAVLLVGAVAVLLAAGLGWLLAEPTVRPLRRLRDRAASVGRGGPEPRPPWRPGTREIDEVAEVLDTLDDDLVRSRAAEAQALDAARAFAATAGHELRTPLTAMSTDLEVLQRHPDLSVGDRAEVVASLVRAGDRLRSTLQALEQLARGELVGPGAMAEVDLVDLVLHAVDEAARHHPGTKVFADVPTGDVRMHGWAPGLRLSLDNLLANAVRHGSAQRVDVRLRAATDVVEIVVDDDGPGIPVVERERVLERFARGSGAVGSGSGLGLALVDQQARLHGGGVTLSDSPSGGLRVVLTLPAG